MSLFAFASAVSGPNGALASLPIFARINPPGRVPGRLAAQPFALSAMNAVAVIDVGGHGPGHGHGYGPGHGYAAGGIAAWMPMLWWLMAALATWKLGEIISAMVTAVGAVRTALCRRRLGTRARRSFTPPPSPPQAAPPISPASKAPPPPPPAASSGQRRARAAAKKAPPPLPPLHQAQASIDAAAAASSLGGYRSAASRPAGSDGATTEADHAAGNPDPDDDAPYAHGVPAPPQLASARNMQSQFNVIMRNGLGKTGFGGRLHVSALCPALRRRTTPYKVLPVCLLCKSLLEHHQFPEASREE